MRQNLMWPVPAGTPSNSVLLLSGKEATFPVCSGTCTGKPVCPVHTVCQLCTGMPPCNVHTSFKLTLSAACRQQTLWHLCRALLSTNTGSWLGPLAAHLS